MKLSIFLPMYVLCVKYIRAMSYSVFIMEAQHDFISARGR